MREMYERQWMELENMWQQFKKEISWFCDELEKHGQAGSSTVKYQTKRDEFSHTNVEDKFQIPQIDCC